MQETLILQSKMKFQLLTLRTNFILGNLYVLDNDE